jgi:hypothetical protein
MSTRGIDPRRTDSRVGGRLVGFARQLGGQVERSGNKGTIVRVPDGACA